MDWSANLCWHKCVLPKAGAFLWTALRGKILTSDRLRIIGIKGHEVDSKLLVPLGAILQSMEQQSEVRDSFLQVEQARKGSIYEMLSSYSCWLDQFESRLCLKVYVGFQDFHWAFIFHFHCYLSQGWAFWEFELASWVHIELDDEVGWYKHFYPEANEICWG